MIYKQSVLFCNQIAGAMAETGASLEEMVPFLEETVKNMGEILMY